jgi:FkbM family methyltransferase
MLRASLVRTGAKVWPAPFRWAITRSARSTPPGPLCNHWLAKELAPRLFPEGVPCFIGGTRVNLPPGAVAHYRRGFEALTRAAFDEAVRPGDVVVDIGANAGYYSIRAAELVGPTGRVYAIEPSPINLPFLRRNVAGLPHVTVLPYAASDSVGTATFHLTTDTVNDGFEVGPYAAATHQVRVDTRPVDLLIRPPVHMIKVDVQGAELAVLRGMRELIAGSPDLKLIIEWSPALLRATNVDPLDVIAAIEGAGLSVVTAFEDERQSQCTLNEMLSIAERDETRERYWNILAERR